MAIDQVHDLQQVYRKILYSMSRPGDISILREQAKQVDYQLPCYDATLLSAMALLDGEVSFHLISEKQQQVGGKISEYTLAKQAPADKADYIIVLQDATELSILQAIYQCKIGDLIDPQNSSTWIIETPKLSNTAELKLMGPGIKNEVKLFTGIYTKAWQARKERINEYPLGIDLIITDAQAHIVCIPRTTTVEITGVE